MVFVYYFFVFLFGLIIGSFLNCLIYRLELSNSAHYKKWAGLSWLNGRSYCPHCKHKLTWQDLIPIFSYFVLRSKCRYCQKKISIQYPLVEISTALVFLLIFNYQFPIINELSILNSQTFINLFFLFYVSSVLIIIFVYDLKYYLIPDKILLPAIIIVFIYRLFENLINWNLIENWSLKIDNFVPLVNYLVSASAAFLFFWLIYLISKGQWMGFGDCKLAILLGLVLGFPKILLGLFLSFLFGAIIGVWLILLNPSPGHLKTELKNQIPFAPFLVIGTFAAMIWGQNIINWYVRLIGLA